MPQGNKPESVRSPARRGRSRKITIVAILLLAAGVGLFVALEIVVHRSEPILKARVIETLSNRFDSHVELSEFHVSVGPVIEVYGGGLTVSPNHLATAYPLFSVKSFHFSTPWAAVLKSPMHIGTVKIDGLDIHLPPKDQRANVPKPARGKGGLKILVDELTVQNATLVLGTSKPGKVPLNFQIGRLDLKAQSSGLAWAYEATLINPRPLGQIHAAGHLGAWQTGSPGDTRIDGNYTFSHADLSTFKGIAGILSAEGEFKGTLNNLTVDGQTDTPDFRLSIAGRPLPLHTTFHAIVDATTGDTYLQPVDAQLLHSHFTATGSVVHVPGKGHDIALDVVIDRGRIEDFLLLTIRADTPLMTGPLQMKAKFDIPPGEEAVAGKMTLSGNFVLQDVHFSSPNIQSKLDELSLRGQGLPKEAKEHVREDARSQLRGYMVLADRRLTLSQGKFDVPGADIDLGGTYSLDGSQLDIHGKIRLQAKLSQMTTGWKSLLLKAVDPFFAKDGAGTVVPFKVTGSRSDMKFGLDFGAKDK